MVALRLEVGQFTHTTTTSRIVAEQLIPTAIEERWTTREFAEGVGCDPATAAKILARRLTQVRRETDRVIFGLTETACCTLERTATRQISRLEMLNSKPTEEWTPADYALERQSLAMLKQVISLSRCGPQFPCGHDAGSGTGGGKGVAQREWQARLDDGL